MQRQRRRECVRPPDCKEAQYRYPFRMSPVAKESPARREADVLTSKKCCKEGKVSQDTKCSPNQHNKGVRKEAVRRSASGESRDRGAGNEFVPPIPRKSNTRGH